MITTVHKFTGTIEVGNRTCDFTARAALQWSANDRPALMELEDVDFTVRIFDEDVEHFKGEYTDMDAPDAEVAYWEERIKIQIKRDLEKRETSDFEWCDGEGRPYSDPRDLIG